MPGEEILTGKGVVLVGEAAKSWVSLQWTEAIIRWIVGCCFILALIGVLVFIIWLSTSEPEKREVGKTNENS